MHLCEFDPGPNGKRCWTVFTVRTFRVAIPMAECTRRKGVERTAQVNVAKATGWYSSNTVSKHLPPNTIQFTKSWLTSALFESHGILGRSQLVTLVGSINPV